MVALFALALTGCARSLKVAHLVNQDSGVVAVWAKWIKKRSDYFQVELHVRNDTQGPVLVPFASIRCGKGGTKGRPEARAFRDKSGMFKFAPNETKSFGMNCFLGETPPGDFEVVLGKVYAQQDSETDPVGPLLAQEVALVIDETGIKAGERPRTTAGGGGPIAAPDLNRTSPPTDTQASAVSTPPTGRGGATADPSWVIAIMDVEDLNASSSKNAIDADLVRNIGDQLRIFVAERGVRTIDRSAQERAFRDQIAALKNESHKACYDDSCQIELGKALAASHILRSKITRFGTKCVLNTELIDLKAEVAISAASARGDCAAEGFLRMSEELATNITGK